MIDITYYDSSGKVDIYEYVAIYRHFYYLFLIITPASLSVYERAVSTCHSESMPIYMSLQTIFCSYFKIDGCVCKLHDSCNKLIIFCFVDFNLVFRMTIIRDL